MTQNPWSSTCWGRASCLPLVAELDMSRVLFFARDNMGTVYDVYTKMCIYSSTKIPKLGGKFYVRYTIICNTVYHLDES